MPRSKPDKNSQLFSESDALKPLAERMRPRTLDEIVGQARLLGAGTPLRRSIEAGHVHLHDALQPLDGAEQHNDPVTYRTRRARLRCARSRLELKDRTPGYC